MIIPKGCKVNKYAFSGTPYQAKKAVAVAAATVSQGAEQAKRAVKQASGVTCSCGTVNPSDAKFCSTCGKSLDGGEGNRDKA